MSYSPHAMTLTVHRSHSTDALVRALADDLREPPVDLFQPDVVVVHGKGLERWLQMRLADQLGICANVVFPTAEDLLVQLADGVLGPDHGLQGWSRDALVWTLLAAFRGEVLDKPALAPLANWLNQPDRGAREVELATRIAGVFHRYAVFRPDMLAEWRAGRGAGWQPQLWREVAGRIGTADLAEVAGLVKEGIGEADLDAFPQRVGLFTVGSIPPLHVELFAALGRRIDVAMYHLSPSEGAWNRLDVRGRDGVMPNPSAASHLKEGLHPLLASCGAQSRDLQTALRTHAADAVHQSHPVGTAAETSLQRLQVDLRNGHSPKTPHGSCASTIEVHQCHGDSRQAGVLRQVLLRVFDEDPTLQPRDVLVMTPDVERFAPLVDAAFEDGVDVFSSKTQDKGLLPKLPYRIADRWIRSENPVAEALLAILAQAETRLKATEVMALLRLPAIHERFGLTADDLEDVRVMVKDAGIRWGADAAHRAREGQPEVNLYTWRFGLDRLLLGSAMAGAESEAMGVQATGETEGGTRRRLLGALAGFADELLALTDSLVDGRTAAQWRAALLEVLSKMVLPRAGWMLEEVRAGLDALADLAAGAGFDGPIERAAVRTLLQGRFMVSDLGRFLDGGITVSQMVPMRSIPFRVVVMLGMDHDAFPRKDSRPGFDLMLDKDSARMGDRNNRIDDRALFLEAILSATDRLVVLYTAVDPTDGKKRPPCVPVGELLDVLQADFVDPLPVVRHGLHGFSEREVGPDPLTYDPRQVNAALAMREPVSPSADYFTGLPAQDPPEDLPAAWLVGFFDSAPDFVCQRRLGLWAPREADATSDHEPERLGGLERWAVKNALLKHIVAGDDVSLGSDVHARIVGQGRLPLGTPGQLVYAETLGQMYAVALQAEPLRAGVGERLRLEAEVDGLMVHSVAEKYAVGIVDVRAGSLGGKQHFELYITHLLANIVEPTATHGVGTGRRVSFEPMSGEEATATLEELVAMYREGWNRPLPMWCDLAWLYERTYRRSKPEWAHKNGADAVNGDWKKPAWCLGEYSLKTYPKMPFWDERGEAAKLARQVWGGLLDRVAP